MMNCRYEAPSLPRVVLGELCGVPSGLPFVMRTTGMGEEDVQLTSSMWCASTRTKGAAPAGAAAGGNDAEAGDDGDDGGVEEADADADADADDDAESVLVEVGDGGTGNKRCAWSGCVRCKHYTHSAGARDGPRCTREHTCHNAKSMRKYPTTARRARVAPTMRNGIAMPRRGWQGTNCTLAVQSLALPPQTIGLVL